MNYLGIKAKTVLEDIGLAKSGSFASVGNNYSEEDKKMLKDEYDKLDEELKREGKGHYIHHVLMRKKKGGKGVEYMHKGKGKIYNTR